MPQPGARSVGLLAAICVGSALGQENPPLPPRIVDDPPGQASLAPLPADREEVIEEIVVVARNEWRLPDLGANWRARFDPPAETRVAIRYLPLYDPEMADRWPDLFQLSKQEERTGYIELFRVRFGAEPRQAAVPTVLNPDP